MDTHEDEEPDVYEGDIDTDSIRASHEFEKARIGTDAARIKKIEAERDVALELIKKLEWGNRRNCHNIGDIPACHICLGFKPGNGYEEHLKRYDSVGHKDDCDLAAILNAIPSI